MLALDAGSTDPGPYYLGAGVPFVNRRAAKKDLTMILDAARARRIPVLIGSAGGGGGRPHLEWTLDLYRELCRERGYRFRTAVIDAEVDRGWLRAQVAAGRVRPLDHDRALTGADVDAATRIVAQMGVEPFLTALDAGAEVVIAGRACDAAVSRRCRSTPASTPAWRSTWARSSSAAPRPPIRGTARTACSASSRTTRSRWSRRTRTRSARSPRWPRTRSTSAPIPTSSTCPTATSTSRRTRFEAAGERAVRVSGTRFVPAATPTLKLEGVARVGFRTLAIAGVREPQLIANLDAYLANVRTRVADTYPDGYRLIFHVYGRDGVMGPLEPVRGSHPHEIGLIIEVIADDAETSAAVLALARSVALHVTYPGRKAIAGNLAFPFSPSDLRAGEAYEFTIHHLVAVDDPGALFRVEMIEA